MSLYAEDIIKLHKAFAWALEKEVMFSKVLWQPSIIYITCLLKVVGKPEPIPADFRPEVVHTLYMSIYHRSNT